MSDSCLTIWSSGDKTEDKAEISVLMALNSLVQLKNAGFGGFGELCRDEDSVDWISESRED